MLTVQAGRFDLPSGPLPESMFSSDARGLPLLKRGDFAADLIRFPPGGCVPTHTHPGSHILLCVGGLGWVIAGERLRLNPGVCYLVPGETPHAIEAETELTLVSVSDQHVPVGSERRLDLC